MGQGELYNIDYVSSQAISSSRIQTGYSATTGADVINKTYGDANYGGAGGNGSGQRYAYDYTVFQDGANTVCQRGSDGATVQTSTNDRDVIQYALTQGGRIYIQYGNYALDDVLNVTQVYTQVEGAGRGTRLTFSPSRTHIGFMISGTRYCGIKSLRIDLADIGVCVRESTANFCDDLRLESVDTYGCNTGIDIQGAYAPIVSYCTTDTGKVNGFKYDGDSRDGVGGGLTLIGHDSYNNSGSGILIQKAVAGTIIGGVSEHNEVAGIMLSGVTEFFVGGFGSEYNSMYSYSIANTPTVTSRNIVLDSCYGRNMRAYINGRHCTVRNCRLRGVDDTVSLEVDSGGDNFTLGTGEYLKTISIDSGVTGFLDMRDSNIVSESISSQSISGGTITTGHTPAVGADVINKTYGDANYAGGSGRRYAYQYGVYFNGANYSVQKGSDGTVPYTGTCHRAIQYGIDNASKGEVRLLTDVTLTATISGADDVTFDLGGHRISIASAFTVVKMHQGFDIRNGEMSAFSIDFTGGIMIAFNASVAEGSYTPGYSPTNVEDLTLFSNNQKGTAIKLNNTTAGRGLSFVKVNNIHTFKFDKTIHCYVNAAATPCYINLNEFNDIHGTADNNFIYLERPNSALATEIAGNQFNNCRWQATANTKHVVYASSNQNIRWNKFNGSTFDWAGAGGQYAYCFNAGNRNNMVEDMMIGSVGVGTPRFKYVSSQATNYNRFVDMSYNRNALRNIYSKYIHSEYQGGDLNLMLDSGASSGDDILIVTRNATNDADVTRLAFTNQATRSYANFSNCNVKIDSTSTEPTKTMGMVWCSSNANTHMYFYDGSVWVQMG